MDGLEEEMMLTDVEVKQNEVSEKNITLHPTVFFLAFLLKILKICFPD